MRLALAEIDALIDAANETLAGEMEDYTDAGTRALERGTEKLKNERDRRVERAAPKRRTKIHKGE